MSIGNLLVSEFDAEMKKTRTALERVPADKADFAPHPKSMPLGKLAPHVAQLAGFGLSVLTTPGLNFQGQLQASAPGVRGAVSPGFRRRHRESSQRPRKHPRRSMDGELEAVFRRQIYFRRFPFPRVPADVSQPYRASSCPARRLFALNRRASTGHLRPLRGRQARFLSLIEGERSTKRNSGVKMGEEGAPSFAFFAKGGDLFLLGRGAFHSLVTIPN